MEGLALAALLGLWTLTFYGSRRKHGELAGRIKNNAEAVAEVVNRQEGEIRSLAETVHAPLADPPPPHQHEWVRLSNHERNGKHFRVFGCTECPDHEIREIV